MGSTGSSTVMYKLKKLISKMSKSKGSSIQSVTSPLSRAQIETAIAKYGPTLALHPQEEFLPTSIEWYLAHATLVNTKATKGGRIVHPTQEQLPIGAKDGTSYELLIEDEAKVGDFSQAKAYVNCVWREGQTFTDIQFWVFSAWNGPATARFDSLVLDKSKRGGDVDLSPLGTHWADWEYIAIRIDNRTQELIGLILSAHGKNEIYGTDQIAKTFQMVPGTRRTRIYSSLNGHANFPSVGDNYTEHRKILGTPAGLEFNLINRTADGGKTLNCATEYQLVSAEWLKAKPDAIVVPNWVGYLYRWGPEGTTSHLDSKTVGEIVLAVLGPDARPLLKDPVLLLAAELLAIFVKQDVNGAAAPATQAPWSGNYA